MREFSEILDDYDLRGNSGPVDQAGPSGYSILETRGNTIFTGPRFRVRRYYGPDRVAMNAAYVQVYEACRRWLVDRVEFDGLVTMFDMGEVGVDFSIRETTLTGNRSLRQRAISDPEEWLEGERFSESLEYIRDVFRNTRFRSWSERPSVREQVVRRVMMESLLDGSPESSFFDEYVLVREPMISKMDLLVWRDYPDERC